MSETVSLFDPNTGSFASIIDGVLQIGAASGASATITKPIAITTATLSNPASSIASTTILAANANRLGAVIFNDSTAVLRLKFGATASASSFTYLLASNASLIINSTQLYTGVIDGIWDAENGSARVTELS